MHPKTSPTHAVGTASSYPNVRTLPMVPNRRDSVPGGLGEGCQEGGGGGRVGRLAVGRGVDVPLRVGQFGRDDALDVVGEQGQSSLSRHPEAGGHQPPAPASRRVGRGLPGFAGVRFSWSIAATIQAIRPTAYGSGLTHGS
jgi:hypothetical protein